MSVPQSVPQLIKTCTICHRELPATPEYFHRKKSGKYGLKSICKECRAVRKEHYQGDGCAYHAEYREKRRQEARDYATEYRKTHEPELLTYRKVNREKARVTNTQYRQLNPEHIHDYGHIYRQTHLKERSEYGYRYRETHREQLKSYNANPRTKAIRRVISHRYRAREAQAKGTYTQAEFDVVLKAHTDAKGRLRCAWCGKPITNGKYHIDHFIPLSKGGTNDAGNLRVLHDKCNESKGAKLPASEGKLI